MTTNKPDVVESECYQCGRLKTALSYRSRCLTCETQRADANADENDELRARLSDYEALQAECELLRAAIRRLCNIYVVDDYHEGQLREERLEAAVNRAINAIKESGNAND